MRPQVQVFTKLHPSRPTVKGFYMVLQVKGSPIPGVPYILKINIDQHMEALRVSCFAKLLPFLHILHKVVYTHDYTAMRSYIPHLVSPCKSLCPFRPDHSPHIPMAVSSYRTTTCVPCGCSRRCEALSPEPQRPWELTSPRSLFFPQQNHPTGHPRVTWFHRVKHHRLLAA